MKNTLERKKGRKKKIILLLFSFVATFAGIILLLQIWACSHAICVARVSFTGFENMFHIPYEYYAVTKHYSIRVPEAMVKLAFGNAPVQQYFEDDEDTACWLVSLDYAEDSNLFVEGDYVETSFGEGYRLYYQAWNTWRNREPGAEDLLLMQQIIETLHSGDLNDWISQWGGVTGLTNFILFRNGDQYLLKTDDLYIPFDKDGEHRKILKFPEGGDYDYFYFPD